MTGLRSPSGTKAPSCLVNYLADIGVWLAVTITCEARRDARGLNRGTPPSALFNKELRAAVPRLGQKRDFTSAKAQTMLGWRPRPLEETCSTAPGA